MAISRLFMEFVAVDAMSTAVGNMTRKLAGMGEAGKRAADDITRGTQQMARGFQQLTTARELGQRFLMPGLQAAGSREAALNRLLASTESGLSKGAEVQLLGQANTRAGDIAQATKFNSTDVIDQAITEQLRAGLDLDTILKMGGGAQSAAYLAQAEGTDIGTANQAVLTVVAKFGLVGDQVGIAADSLKRFSGASSASVASLNEGLTYISSAKDLGISLDDTLAVLGALDLRGMKGSMGGTSFNEFLTRMTKADQASPQLDFYDQSGTFRGLDSAVSQLREFFGGMNQEQQQLAANKLFGDQGSRALFALLNTEGASALEAVRAAAKSARGLDESVGIMAKGAFAEWEAAAGTTEDMLATMFQPLLGPAATLGKAMNDAAATAKAFYEKDPTRATIASGLAMAVVGGVGAMGVANMGRGAFSALGGLRAGSGLMSTAAGVAEGKALEAATGVSPVFVTNWPTGGLGGLSGAAGAAGGLAGAGGALGVLGKAGVLGAAGMAGWGAGTAINEGMIKGTVAEDAIQAMIAGSVKGVDFWTGGRVLDRETVKGADQAYDRFAPTRWLKEMLGLKVTVNVDQSGSASVISDGVDNVEVAASRRGGS